MIQRHFSLEKPYRVVIYARMSLKSQKQRSPEQQQAAILEVMRRHACPWTVVKVYSDRAIKGRYFKRRLKLQEMLRDIEVGLIKVDLIAVNTLERFGRAEEFAALRHKLLVNHGVMIVAADNSFADPTGIVGKAVGMIEQIRSTEEGRIKAHQVVRGEKDALRQKRWPGGPVPFGYRLKKSLEGSGPNALVYSTLEPNPLTAPILQKIFAKAHETGWGGTRLASFFNSDPTIPAEHKPFYSPTMTFWLSNEIYIGVGIWGTLSTDILNDARVIEANPHPEEIVRVEDFCQPLVAVEVFEAIRAVRLARSRPKPAAETDGQKLIAPLSPGLSVKNCLAGMVHCGGCNACSVPRCSGRQSKAGQQYTYYNCPRHNDGACDNDHHVRVDRLEPAVFSRLRQRLLPVRPGEVPPWFGDMVGRIEAQVKRLLQEQPREADRVRQQIRQLDEQISGWRQSLGNPQLPATLRQDLERDYEAARQQKSDLEARLIAQEAMQQQVAQIVDPQKVIDALKRLEQILAGENACLVNIELARHIERIDCYKDGRIVLRGTWLGVFDGAMELLSRTDDGQASAPLELTSEVSSATALPKVRSRRLARRRVNDLSDSGTAAAPPASDALDPHRFAGLAECFRWEEHFVLDRDPYWSEAHADAVAAKKAEDPQAMTLVALAAHFGVSTPTIRKTLRIAEAKEKRSPETHDPAPASGPEIPKRPDQDAGDSGNAYSGVT